MAICALHVVLAMAVRQSAIYVGDDDAGYVLLARAILEGHYRALQHVGLPWEARFPPGYPLLLAGITALFGERIDAMLAVGIIVSVLGLVLLFDLVRKHWSPGFALIACAVVAINPSQVHNAGSLQSETLFTTTAILAIWLAERASRSGGDAPRSVSACTTAAAFAALVRIIGVVLLIALCFTWAVQRRFRSAIVAGMLALTIGVGWSAWTAAAPDARARRTYGNVLVEWVFGGPREPGEKRQVSNSATLGAGRIRTDTGTSRPALSRNAPAAFPTRLAHRASRSAVRYATELIPSVLAAPTIAGTRVDNVLWLLTFVACMLAGTTVMWTRVPTVAAHVAAYTLFLLFWPAFILRFTEPLVPFLVLWMLAGAQVLGKRFTPRSPHAFALALALLLVPEAIQKDADAMKRSRACDRIDPLTASACASADVRAFLAAARFSASLPPEDSVFLAPKERPFFYYSGRRTLVMGAAVDRGADTLGAYLRHTSARGVVIARVGYPRPYELLRDSLLKSCRDFDVIREFAPSVVVLRVRPVTDSAAVSPACEALSRLPTTTKVTD